MAGVGDHEGVLVHVIEKLANLFVLGFLVASLELLGLFELENGILVKVDDLPAGLVAVHDRHL